MIKISIAAAVLSLSVVAANAQAQQSGYDPVSSPQAAAVKACISKGKKLMPAFAPSNWRYFYTDACVRSGH